LSKDKIWKIVVTEGYMDNNWPILYVEYEDYKRAGYGGTRRCGKQSAKDFKTYLNKMVDKIVLDIYG